VVDVLLRHEVVQFFDVATVDLLDKLANDCLVVA